MSSQIFPNIWIETGLSCLYQKMGAYDYQFQWWYAGGNPGSHNIQGIGPGFIPQNLDTAYIDEVIAVPTAEAMTRARRLAREGLLLAYLLEPI